MTGLKKIALFLLVGLGLAVTHVAAYAAGQHNKNSISALRRELPVELAYFESRLAVLSTDATGTLMQTERTLKAFDVQSLNQYPDRTHALMMKAIILATKSRALTALGRTTEAIDVANVAARVCSESGRKGCTPDKMIQYSRKLLGAAWEESK